MDTRRFIIFIVLSFAILFGWQEWQRHAHPEQYLPKAETKAATSPAAGSAPAASDAPAVQEASTQLQRTTTVKVKTDLFEAHLDTMGADLRRLVLLKHGEHADPKKPMALLQDGPDHIHVAQTGLLMAGMPNLPTHRTLFATTAKDVELAPGQDSVTVRFEAPPVGGVKVAKLYTFKRGSYVMDVKYEIVNTSSGPLSLSSYYRLLRDNKVPEGSDFLGASTFTGPAIYTDEKKFKKIEFKDIDKGKQDLYPAEAKDGWVAMLQHYFASAWLLSANGNSNVCAKTACRFEIKAVGDNNYQAAAVVTIPTILPDSRGEITVPLFVGPQETRALEAAATGLEFVKDYGIFTVLAKPLFWLLSWIHELVGNWGWAIVLLTILIKTLLYPLAAASYRSMARMKKLAPRMERLKAQHGDDRMKFQQAVMELYKTEKVNPLGGCLPMLVQIPVFIALYWTLLAAVELRQAPWIFWITDLSIADPYYVLPVLMGITSYVQTMFNPPSTDPLQDKMMKIMPVIFSVMFLFFPAGLVLYYVVQNILTIAQQWYVTRSIEKAEDKS